MKSFASSRLYSTSKNLFFLAFFTAFPLMGFRRVWSQIWGAGRSRAWDGSAHYAMAQIYDQSIFPDTFGWTQVFFGGMPFPNFYPPFFYWCVALFHHAHLLSFQMAFKLLVAVPLILMPAIIWFLARTVSDNNTAIAAWAAFACTLFLVDPRWNGSEMWPSGLDYHSTLLIGLYTQPLGFLLLISWYVTYLKPRFKPWSQVLMTVLLALTVLTNFFNAVIATLLIITTLAVTLLKYARTPDGAERLELRRALLVRFLTPLIAASLTLFWTVPMLREYGYLVTLPVFYVPWTSLLIVWYVCALIGVICWLRRPTRGMWPFLAAYFALAAVMLCAVTLSPRWFPFQAPRFLSTLNFFSAVPAGHGLATVYRILENWLHRALKSLHPALATPRPYLAIGLMLLFMGGGYLYSNSTPVKYYSQLLASAAFYPTDDEAAAQAQGKQAEWTESLEDFRLKMEGVPQTPAMRAERMKTEAQSGEQSLAAILNFARAHRDGRYLVGLPEPYGDISPSHDARSINHYLGVQGNETVIATFREASPNAVFVYPQVNAFSVDQDTFGISSALANDVDFGKQELSKHLARARVLGVRYLVIRSPKIKERLAQEPEIGAQHDFGTWTVMELKHEPPPHLEALPFKPALVFSDLSFKRRRRNETTFTRFAEEQFADGWFDVMLALSPEKKIDHLSDGDISRFGAIILDKYDCDDCDLALRRLREFAKSRPLILLGSESASFARLKSGLADLPLVQVIDRQQTDPGEWMENLDKPTDSYQSNTVRQQWASIRNVLEQHKVAAPAATVGGEVNQNSISLNYEKQPGAAVEEGVPVLIRTTFHPNWLRNDGDSLYLTTPAYMLTFVRQPATLRYARSSLDYLGLWASASVLVMLLGYLIFSYSRRFVKVRKPLPVVIEGAESSI